MNQILQLKGQLNQKSSKTKPGPANIPKGEVVKVEHLSSLKENLESVRRYWKKQRLEINPLISVYYSGIVAKSNRIKGLLESGISKNNASVVGAKFKGEPPYQKHVITHCVTDKILADAVKNLEIVIGIVEKFFNGQVTHEDINDINKNKFKHIFETNKSSKKIAKTRFVNILVDAYYVEKLDVEREPDAPDEDAIVTLYETGTRTETILEQLEIDPLQVDSLDETTILLQRDQVKTLKEKAPYLISMAVSDFSKVSKVDILPSEKVALSIPDPGNEPTIGVIDTLFDEEVYFSKWVDFENRVNIEIGLTKEDYVHGTMVTSLIVDGPSLNPDLDDGCGRFKVRHFGVSTQGKFSSFTVIKEIREIVESNRDIKVWNLSLGSALEINENFISPEAALLDKIQYENDVIFVIAGTNKPDNPRIRKIGAPADSINSLVVNSVTFNNEPASYSREGEVLSFYNKPDVSYYGGDNDRRIKVCSPAGIMQVMGTSFAAPWITRKLAYLIEVLGFTRELAKALIIDSAAGWEDREHGAQLIGFGVVPVKIENIVMTPEDEIKFMINGESDQFETYTYNIPIPEDKDKQPFISKATLCYFPTCTRNQGVDYTNTEMDIHFGRLSKYKSGNVRILTINDNKQSDEGRVILYEESARKQFRKWDNVKHIRENSTTVLGGDKRPKKKIGNGLWGISVKKKERLNAEDGRSLRFGVVVTLKEVNGVNRFEEFIQQCQFRGWLVNRVNVENRIEIYQRAEERLHFD
jgi:serine protease AprX